VAIRINIEFDKPDECVVAVDAFFLALQNSFAERLSSAASQTQPDIPGLKSGLGPGEIAGSGDAERTGAAAYTYEDGGSAGNLPSFASPPDSSLPPGDETGTVQCEKSEGVAVPSGDVPSPPRGKIKSFHGKGYNGNPCERCKVGRSPSKLARFCNSCRRGILSEQGRKRGGPKSAGLCEYCRENRTPDGQRFCATCQKIPERIRQFQEKEAARKGAR
jgi:hypothetical protein